MANAQAMTAADNWKQVAQGSAIYQRFEFESYAKTSGFLAALAAVSEETGIFPDVSFAKTHANVTIPSDGNDAADAAQRDFAAQTDKIYTEIAV